MFDFDAENAELEARNAQLRDRVDDMMRDLQEKTQGLRDAQAAMAAVVGRASSPDGVVTATVDPSGLLTGLELSPRAFERVTPESLARTITGVVREAAADARAQVEEHLAPLATDAEPMLDLPDLLPGAPSLHDLLRVQPVEDVTENTKPRHRQPESDDDEDGYGSVFRKDGW
ncbi:DNA-binding protein YbaB [Crossiella equi]|uniref:DNA-binding protein YbaB n=1 Tax=Crossiella equi TaxID=130796 RepID=A0ABS5AHU1_9PSEU|nr:YbaB/EbfC family nucleoid-associated protein [Crossiella equi]MBP2476138.1 DNA-binding protein YbaB [Crossiella equi]